LFNLADGGDINPMLGKTHNEESRKKISLTHKGRKMTDEQKLNQKYLIQYILEILFHFQIYLKKY